VSGYTYRATWTVDGHWVGWADEFPGLMVQATTEQGALERVAEVVRALEADEEG
jgi:predicted RNase H-like HicB family nuclease